MATEAQWLAGIATVQSDAESKQCQECSDRQECFAPRVAALDKVIQNGNPNLVPAATAARDAVARLII